MYQAAHLTIGVASTEDGSAGYLKERMSLADDRLHTAQEHFKDVTLFTRPPLGHAVPQQLVDSVRSYISYRRPKATSIFGRERCLQERMLGRRVVYYTQEELIWDCALGVRCECGRPIVLSKSSTEQARATSKRWFGNVCTVASSEFALSDYLPLAQEYATRSITFDKDVLPAFSGIAQPFAATGLGPYYVGLWSSELLYMVGWKTVHVVLPHRALSETLSRSSASRSLSFYCSVLVMDERQLQD